MIKEGWGTIKEIKERDSIHFAKVEGDEPNKFLILNHAPVMYEGHFVHGKMIPCEGENCNVCAAGVGKQVRYCFGVYEYRTGWRAVLELSGKQAEVIFDKYLTGDDARGLMITIRRLGKAKTANLRIVHAEYIDMKPREVYRFVDVSQFLEQTWKKQTTPYYESGGARATAEPSQSKKANLKPSEIAESLRIQDENNPWGGRRK